MGAKYLGFYCAIVLNDKKEIKRFLRKILNYHSEKDGANNENKVLRLYQTFGKYFKLKWKNLDSENVKEKIEKQFGKELYKRIIHILNVVNEKAIFESLYSKENSKETDYIKFLQKQIGEICKNNPPNQNEIKNIIQKPNFFEKLFIS